MLKAVLLFAVGLVFLIKGGDWFVDGSVGIARRFHLPELLIGATVVSIGTTLPEVMVSATSAVTGHGEIAYGNAIGSIICNTALIAAITLVAKPGVVDRKTLRVPVAFFFVSAILYAGNAYFVQYFHRWFGFLMLAIFLTYMVVNVVSMKKQPAEGISSGDVAAVKSEGTALAEGAEPGASEEAEKEEPLWLDLVKLVAGAALIAVGADLLVDNGTLIAAALGVPESVIALTFVALGTSLPELVTASTSLVKGHGSLSLGNVIGANVFNLVLVSGVSVAISPFALPETAQFLGRNASLVLEIPVMFAVMLILTVPALIRQKLSRVQGILLLAIYAAFCVIQFTL